jgi:CheY-like chemotaxis protein
VDDTILIADGDRARARRLAEPLAARGLAVSFAETGAAALEAVLADVPGAVIASDALPLIDAARLAEILRANPRTRPVRLVYSGADASARRKHFDEATAGDAAAVADCVFALLGKREQQAPIERATASASTVEGDLAQIALIDVLQLLHQNNRTGLLIVKRADGSQARDHGEIWLRDGNVVQAKAAPRAQDEKALYRMLGWRDGSFSFMPSEETRPARIQAPTRTLLLEGVRQLDEWNRLVRGLPPDSAHVALAIPRTQLPNIVHPVAQEVLLLLDAYDDVRSIVDHCTHSDYQVLRTLQTLIDRGIVRQRRDRERRSTGQGFALFDAAQAKRLREWLEAGRGRRGGVAPAKLLLASADPDATSDLVRALEQLPGATRSQPPDARPVQAADLAPLVRLRVADGLAIELIQVPASPLYAPLWPAAAHGALGLLLIHVSPVSESEARLRALAEAFQRMPDHRTFHVLLLRKGERIAPEEIQEKLTVLANASLFLLHLDGERDSAPLLRTMLGRVMP